MRITILYDNTVFRNDLKSDWGFSCLIEAHNRIILFDTGSDGAILLDKDYRGIMMYNDILRIK